MSGLYDPFLFPPVSRTARRFESFFTFGFSLPLCVKFRLYCVLDISRCIEASEILANFVYHDTAPPEGCVLFSGAGPVKSLRCRDSAPPFRFARTCRIPLKKNPAGCLLFPFRILQILQEKDGSLRSCRFGTSSSPMRATRASTIRHVTPRRNRSPPSARPVRAAPSWSDGPYRGRGR